MTNDSHAALIESPEPGVNQLWRSLDPRDVRRNRRVIVERVEGDFVYVTSLLSGRMGRRSRIHCSRFDGKQFAFVSLLGDALRADALAGISE